MAIKLFGYTLLSQNEILNRGVSPSLVPPKNDDGAATVNENGMGVFGGYSVDFDTYSAYTNEIDLINQYRDLALQPEVDEAISDIINEMVIRDDGDSPVSMNVDALPKVYDETFRQQLLKEFEYVIDLLHFKERCHSIARQFYVDGRLYYDLMIDETRPENGIVELRNVDPRTIRAVREMRDMWHQETGARLTEVVDQYYVYNPMGFRNMANIGSGPGVKVAKDRIAYVNSGIYTPGNVTVLSSLHKAIKPFNQLRMVEDATVIYRITRAPERRVFYIDVADLPTARAEQYVNAVATRYRNRVVYDSHTGEIRDDRKIQSMLEDFFLPRRSNGRGTEVTQLQGGQNLGEMQDVDYFRKKLYRALGVPASRLESSGGGFQLGRTTEITRDEIRFSRFLQRQRDKLATLFDEVLQRHLTLKGIIRSQEQWRQLRHFIRYEFNTDSYFAELKKVEVLKERLNVVQQLDPYVGKYFSEQYVRDHILRLTSEEQDQIKLDIEENPPTPPAGMEGAAPSVGDAEPAAPTTPAGKSEPLGVEPEPDAEEFFFGDTLAKE
jgi:hypothetical protein